MHDESESWRLEPECVCGLCIKAREGILDRVVVLVTKYVNEVDDENVQELAKNAMVKILEAVVPLM